MLNINAAGEDVTAISNTTGGEMPTIAAGTIASLTTKGTLGLLSNSTGTAVVLSTLVANGDIYPWNGQTTGIVISGNVLTIQAGQGVGNIFVGGDFQTLTAQRRQQSHSRHLRRN